MSDPEFLELIERSSLGTPAAKAIRARTPHRIVDLIFLRRLERKRKEVYDDLPIEVCRHNWGWFGKPWPSGTCYDDDGRLIEEMRKDFPEGENCLWCQTPFVEGDRGTAMPSMGLGEVNHVHRECQLRMVVGSMDHLNGLCSCYGGPRDHERVGPDARQDALAVWEWVLNHGV